MQPLSVHQGRPPSISPPHLLVQTPCEPRVPELSPKVLMQSFSTPLTILHVGTCVLLILTVLLQSGKGADISATLGGSSQTIFGSSGGANFFQKLTATLAAVFFCTSMVLTLLASQEKKSVFEGMTLPTQTAPLPGAATPAQPTSGTAAPAQTPAQPVTPTSTETSSKR